MYQQLLFWHICIKSFYFLLIVYTDFELDTQFKVDDFVECAEAYSSALPSFDGPEEESCPSSITTLYSVEEADDGSSSSPSETSVLCPPPVEIVPVAVPQFDTTYILVRFWDKQA